MLALRNKSLNQTFTVTYSKLGPILRMNLAEKLDFKPITCRVLFDRRPAKVMLTSLKNHQQIIKLRSACKGLENKTCMHILTFLNIFISFCGPKNTPSFDTKMIAKRAEDFQPSNMDRKENRPRIRTTAKICAVDDFTRQSNRVVWMWSDISTPTSSFLVLVKKGSSLLRVCVEGVAESVWMTEQKVSRTKDKVSACFLLCFDLEDGRQDGHGC